MALEKAFPNLPANELAGEDQQDEERERAADYQAEKDEDENPTSGIGGECVYRGQNAGTYHEGTQQTQSEHTDGQQYEYGSAAEV